MDIKGKEITQAELLQMIRDASGINGEYSIDFSWCNLEGADLSDVILCHGRFVGCNLKGVNFNHSFLSYSNMLNAYLGGTDFSGAVLTGSDFSCSDLQGANLRGAEMSGVRFINARLADVKINWYNTPLLCEIIRQYAVRTNDRALVRFVMQFKTGDTLSLSGSKFHPKVYLSLLPYLEADAATGNLPQWFQEWYDKKGEVI